MNDTYLTYGRILRGIGGLYTVCLSDSAAHAAAYPGTQSPLAGLTLQCRARGTLRGGDKPAVGDFAEMQYTSAAFTSDGGRITPRDDLSGLPDAAISAILPRHNYLIRPPMANLDLLFVTCAAASPAPVPETIDKILSIAEYNGIEPVVVIGKCELDAQRAAALSDIYTRAGYRTFPLSCKTGDGVAEFAGYVRTAMPGKCAAFAGASGVGKSTLYNAVFPGLDLACGEISRKIGRGRHTTRQVVLFPVAGGYLADTPGFSLIDFEAFDFFPLEELSGTMRDFKPYLGKCRYDDCSHTREEGCAVLDAVQNGKIAPSRHSSYLSMYAVLKNKHKWDSKSR